MLNSRPRPERLLIIKYALLTLAIFLPLLWAFLFIRNLYPVPAWNMMMAGGDLERGRTYWVLRGETVSGETVDIRPISLTNSMYGRTWTMVNAIFHNQSFKLKSIHPDNTKLLLQVDGLANLPPGARLPDLLLVWGRLYNDQQPASSPQRLRAIRLDMYRWEGGHYSNYDKFVESWRREF